MEPDYPVGAVKQDAESHAVAVRSANPADAPNAWAIMHPQHGGHWAGADEVADWPDVPGTPVPAAEAVS